MVNKQKKLAGLEKSTTELKQKQVRKDSKENQGLLANSVRIKLVLNQDVPQSKYLRKICQVAPW